MNQETKNKISEKLKGNQNYKFRKPRVLTEEQKKKCGQSNIGKIPWNKGLNKLDPRVAKYGKGISKAKSKSKLSEEHKAHIRETCRSEEYRKRHSEATRHAIRKPKTLNHMQNVLKAVCTRPNKFETRALAYLEYLYPNRFIYSGDGTCIINNRSADAIDLKSKTVVLFHGIYWHLIKKRLEITEQNKRHIESMDSEPFLSAGYSVIFIWEDDFNKNLNSGILITYNPVPR